MIQGAKGFSGRLRGILAPLSILSNERNASVKKLLLLGVGAQGSTVAKRMNEEPNVSEIICADYDEKAVNEMGRTLDKAKALRLDARKVENIVRAAEGVDLIVNALPLRFGENVLKAALEVKANYQDFAAAEFENIDWVEGIKLMLTEWSDRFKAQGLSALMSTGSAPGLANVRLRRLDEQVRVRRHDRRQPGLRAFVLHRDLNVRARHHVAVLRVSV